MKLIVLDTNVIIFALLSPSGKPAQIFKRVLKGDFKICTDERILTEYHDVLTRPKFNFNIDSVNAIMRFLRTFSLIVSAPALNVAFNDISDKKFFEVAKFCNADLITGNLKHFPKDPCIKSVNDF